MSAPPIAERHKHHFHRQSPIKESVRAATTANITISTALNNGDTLDGVTLATGDRVLVKDQSSAAGNGIYVVGATPVRDYDVSTDDPAFGFLVYVREGTTNGGTVWKNTNTSAPTIDTTSLTFAQVTSGSALTVKDEGSDLDTAVTSIDFVGSGVTATNVGHAVTVTIPTATHALDDLTDVTISSATAADRLRFDGSVWRNSSAIWVPSMTFDGTNWLVVVTGDGDAVMTEVS